MLRSLRFSTKTTRRTHVHNLVLRLCVPQESHGLRNEYGSHWEQAPCKRDRGHVLMQIEQCSAPSMSLGTAGSSVFSQQKCKSATTSLQTPPLWWPHPPHSSRVGCVTLRDFSSKTDPPQDVYVHVVATPNPNALKFMPGCDVTGTLNTVTVTRADATSLSSSSSPPPPSSSLSSVQGGADRLKNEEIAAAVKTDLARELMAMEGVEGVMFGYDFVTLRKSEDIEWDDIERQTVEILQRFAAAAMDMSVPILAGVTCDDHIDTEEGNIAGRVRELLQLYVRPNVQADGGDVQFCGFKDGVVWLSLTGACTSCPSSTATVRVMIKNLLQHHIEEVQDVRPIDEADPFAKGYVKGVKLE